jgi:hypothetical protein
MYLGPFRKFNFRHELRDPVQRRASTAEVAHLRFCFAPGHQVVSEFSSVSSSNPVPTFPE